MLRRLAWILVGVGMLCTAPAMAADTRTEAPRPVVRSAAEIDYPPLCFVAGDGRATGLAVELLEAAAAAMGREVTFRTGAWPAVKGLLERDEIDALPLVGRTPEREDRFDFTFPYLSLHGAIVVREETADIDGVDDLKGRDVAVLKGDNAEEFLLRTDPGCRIHPRLSFETALKELSAGQHDAVVVQRLLAGQIIEAAALTNLKIVAHPLAGLRQDFCFAVTEGDRQTLALLNEGLALVMADGTAKALQARWLGALDAPALSPVTVLLYAAGIAGPVIVFVLGFSVWWLRREMRCRTADLARSRDRVMENEAELQRATGLLSQISAAQSSYIATRSPQATFDQLLEALVAMTDSQFGFLDEVLEDGDGSRYKLSLSLSNIAWDADARKLYDGLRAKKLEFRNLENLSGFPALTGELLIANDAANDPRAGGLPPGHPPIRCFMGLPLVFGDRLVGVAGIANRAGGYDEQMARFLEPFLAACASIIHAVRQQVKEGEMVSALRRNENFLETIVDNIPDMIFVKDARGLRFVRLNRAGEELLGYSREAMLGKNDHDFFPKAQADFFTAKDREVLTQGTLHEIPEETVNTRHKGERILHTKKIPLMNEKGLPEYLLGISEDITERRKFEAAQRRTQRLESVGTLAGGIAHDFNNLLYPIVGMAEMIMEDHAPGSETHECAEEIFRAAQRGSQLVRQILAVSHRSGHECLPMRLQPVVKEALDLARATIPAQVSIERAIDDACGPVLADPTQVHQVVLNLLTNAHHAVEENGGCISVELAVAPAAPDDGLADPGGYARLAVADTGVGMSPAVQERIFEPYFTTKAQGRGSGLGLAVVHGIVKEMGGKIRVSSQAGRGTQVELLLPLVDQPAAARPAAMAVRGGTERILVVDDEDAVVRLETRMLERLGYRVTAFRSSRAALAALAADPQAYDLVLTDMSMPEMSGDRLARELLAIRPDLPVVLCTGYSERMDAARAHALGIRALLTKPVDKAQMARTIRQVLEEKKTEKGCLTVCLDDTVQPK